MKLLVRILIVVLVLAVGGFFVAEYLISAGLKKKVDKELVDMKEKVEVTYEKFQYSLFKQTYALVDVTAKPVDSELEFYIDEVKVDRADYHLKHEMVTGLELNVLGMRVHQETETGEKKPVFEAYGYEDPKLDMALDYKYDPDLKDLSVSRLQVGNDDMGHMNFAIEMGGITQVDPEKLQNPNPAALMGTLASVTMKGGEILYKDSGLMPRVMAEGAKKEGVTKEAYQEKMVADLQKLKFLKLPDPMMRSLENFIRNPDRIRIVSAPTNPVALVSVPISMTFGASVTDIFAITISN